MPVHLVTCVFRNIICFVKISQDGIEMASGQESKQQDGGGRHVQRDI